MSILDLSTEKTERDYVNIDGAEYELARLDDLSFTNSAYISYVGRKLSSIDEADTWAEIEKMSREYGEDPDKLLYNVVEIILPGLPKEVHDKLSDMQRLRVIQVFSEAEQPAGEGAPQTSTE